MLLLHNKTLSHPSANNAYRCTGSFTFSHLGQKDGLQNLTFLQSALVLSRSAFVAFFFHYVHVLAVVIPRSLFRRTTQTATVKAATKFSTNSSQSLDCCQSQFSFRGLPTDIATKMLSEYRMKYGDGDVIYVSHRFCSGTE